MKTKTVGIRREKDGTATIDKIVVIDGERIHIYKKGIQSVAIAKQLVPDLEREAAKKRNSKMAIVLFDDLVDEYLEYKKICNFALNTVKGIWYNLEKYDIPEFHNRFIEDAFSSDSIYAFYKKISELEEVSIRRKNKVIGETRRLIVFARKRKYLNAQQCDDCIDVLEGLRNVGCYESGCPKTWTSEETSRFLNAIPKDSMDYVMFSLEVWLGARKSELLALQKKCFVNGCIVIQQQIVPGNDRDTVLTKTLKTRLSHRVCPLTNDLSDLLSYYIEARGLNDDDFLFFSNAPDKWLSKTEFGRKLKHYEKMAKVPLISPHGFRHTRVKRFKEVCKCAADFQAASRFMGHQVSVDMNIYGKADDNDVINLIQKESECALKNHNKA